MVGGEGAQSATILLQFGKQDSLLWMRCLWNELKGFTLMVLQNCTNRVPQHLRRHTNRYFSIAAVTLMGTSESQKSH